ncbi:MAG: hypothetical protein P9X22_02405 [Candidatus Zapsychrus exili]|nr:hypothetical protein [Candidatus Zapsychrus exili]
MKKLRIIIFDVEHGFSAFINSPNNYTMLIDCGATSYFSPIKYVLENELNNVSEYNGAKLTEFILTHPHDDHITDIARLAGNLKPAILSRQKYNWEEIKTGDDEEYENLDTYSAWQEEYNTPITMPPDWGMTLNHSMYLSIDEARKINEDKFINNTSMPTFIEYAGHKIVFPGDLEKEGWQSLLRKEGFDAFLHNTSFFVTSHHGHSSGYCNEIFECMGKPHFNIVSAHTRDESVESAYSNPENSRGVLHNGQTRRMFSTRNDGSLIIEISENGEATFDLLNFTNNISIT